MSRLITYRDLVRQRIKWNKALKRAKFFRGEEFFDYAGNTAVEYHKWIDECRKHCDKAAAEQAAELLMQLQAIQDVMEERLLAK